MSSNVPEMQFGDLAERLHRLSVNEKSSEAETNAIMNMSLEDLRQEQAEINAIMNMSLEDLCQEKVSFGKAHVGKTFQEMATETKYLTWFTETFANQNMSSCCDLCSSTWNTSRWNL